MHKIIDEPKIEGYVNIKLVDRRSGKVDVEVKGGNTFHLGFASGVTGELVGEAGEYLGKITDVDLYDANDNLIKRLANPTLERNLFSDRIEVKARFEDASTDTYTVAGVLLIATYGSSTRAIAFKKGLNTSKPSTKKLVVDWVIVVRYAQP